ncbi:MAG: hypothetical protein ACI4DU_09720 [Lachnospiraceae bacterium]
MIIEKLKNFRLFLFDDFGMIIAVIGVLTGLIAYFAFKKKTMRWLAILFLLITILLTINYIDFKYINPVEEQVGDNNLLVDVDNLVIEEQNPSPETEVQISNTGVIHSSGSEINEEDYSDQPPNISEYSNLSLNITEYSVFKDGYHFEYPDPENPEMTCIIDFSTGVFGKFEYSRSLNETELANWFHGGKLFDEAGNEIGEEGNYPSFWSSPDGMFAVEFPEGMTEGTYTYELYQYVDNQYISDSINFTIE